ncbi:MAG TPA: heavy metal translocating P-type ATPase [Fermentimonas caenicola]|mgnify:CR=1 FL=1|jgi:Cd2+/Zn2+-exporting ATPase|uniref:heavy metal translocating P-type ATPase n=1 Tax=Lascolabacillus sp. TaxID=1924068 RepID=UPI0012116983|nr:heavy metal translocating P-type ATPase [Lascolabacillus sp.]MBP6176110.1 heavy metal translocating P-type ATPase [Fermentimonas sp.]MDI9624855.1 heavy metal translocating P-type ATPase [Bacteroidota bacterium]TAH60857.1 MAG: heavy metal translocating P-type ATPase [Fermentimonas caenicola]MBP6197905.1 heavy metal translocating P-type ATPase [Fermentimonas sp.]MBP7104896.1 heavy metal translocating P-type ATPase [Fermentimonas sp.]
MQSFIFKNKNLITFLSAILITTAFISKWTVDNLYLFTWSLVIATVIGALPIALQAYQAIRIKVVSIDVLVTIAVIGAFLIQNYEESAIVTFLFLFGAYLEQRTLKHTRSAIKELTDMAPESALKMIENGEFIEIDVDDVNEGDLLLVKTGAKVPVDGRVISGEGYINEASITGESLPVDKEKDSMVYAGTILENGTLQIVADRVGEDTTFGRIIDLVEEAQDSKSQVEKFIDRFSKYYTPVVLILAFVVWIITNNIELAITLLVLGCPGALVIGVPVSNVAGIGNGARHGVLLKGSEVITEFSKVNSMVFDKTGTLTVGDPSVSETIYYTEDSAMVLSYLASIERESDHPLAKAILNELGEIELHNVENTEVVKGGGIVANINGQRIAVGNISLMEKEDVTLSDNVMADIDRLIKKGNSLVLTSVDGKLKLLIGIRDQIRSGVKKELSRLKKMGVKNLIMLSGDNQGAVDVISRELGLSEAYGDMLPEDKSAYINKLQSEGQIVAFIGDGVNDSPSLALANVGIAMGSGTDVAIETSDLVLMNSDFSRLTHALGLTKATSRNMKQNIVIALGVVLVLFTGLLFSGWVSMSVGMLVHELSILVVILNGMRLLGYKL